MDLKAIQQLLQEAQPIIQKSKAEMKEREAKGEYFNVFENLHFTRPEEHLHTPFLRMLLDKDANHGVGKGFLEAFLDKVVKRLKPDFQYDVNSSHVEYKDKYIGEVKISEKDGESTGGEIDIFYMMRKGMLSSLKTSLIDMVILLKSNQDNLSDIIISEKRI